MEKMTLEEVINLRYQVAHAWLNLVPGNRDKLIIALDMLIKSMEHEERMIRRGR